MKVGQLDFRRRDPRTPYPKQATVRSGGRQVEGTVEDISASGVAINMALPLDGGQFENNQFVELQIEGLGQVTGNVARAYPGGVAVHFDADQEGRERIDEVIEKISRLA